MLPRVAACLLFFWLSSALRSVSWHQRALGRQQPQQQTLPQPKQQQQQQRVLWAGYPGLSPGSKYGDYNYSNYFNDIKDVNPADSNWEYSNPAEEFPASAADDEILEELRLKKQLANDVWQSTLLRDTQGGKFVGSYEVFVPRRNKDTGDLGLARLDAGSSTCEISAGAFDATFGVSINFSETYDTASTAQSPNLAAAAATSAEKLALSMLLRPTRPLFAPDEFRTARGNQCVGAAFSVGQFEQQGALHVAELGIREGLMRIRVRFAYQRVSAPGQSSTILSQQEVDSGSYALELLGFAVIKEALESATPFEVKPLLLDEPGVALYDPQASGEPYVELRFKPRLTILYPRALMTASPLGGPPTVLTIQWEGRDGMRYQVDRKFVDLLGSIKTLELTEIRTQDAEAFPPTFQPVDLLK